MSNIVQTQPQTGTIQAKSEVEFTPFGSDDKIKLSLAVIRNYIAVPTREAELPDERDCMRFLMLCRSRRLDPFTGDAYMIGFKKSGAPKAEWSLITSQSAFMKRAEIHPEFDGLQSGVIVKDPEDRLVEREGDFLCIGDELLGGWATVYFKTRKFPMRKKVQLATYRKNFGVWVTDPAGMICKVAEVHALRDAFPTMLGGMLLREETHEITAEVLQQSETRRPEFAKGLPAPDLREQPSTAAGTVRKMSPASTSDIALTCPVIALLSGDDYASLHQLPKANPAFPSTAQSEILLSRVRQGVGTKAISFAEPTSACFIRHDGSHLRVDGEYRLVGQGVLGFQGVIAVVLVRFTGNETWPVSETSGGDDGIQVEQRDDNVLAAQHQKLRPAGSSGGQGNRVSPSATVTSDDQAEAEAGLAPSTNETALAAPATSTGQTSAPEASPQAGAAAPKNDPGTFKAKEGESIPLTSVRRWLHTENRTEAELMKVLIANKAAKNNQRLSELSEAKLDNVWKARSTLLTQMNQQPTTA